MRVWIDQDLCTGDGICTELAPKVFMMHDDGLAYVKDPSWPNLFGPSGQGKEPMLKMAEGTAEFPDSMLDGTSGGIVLMTLEEFAELVALIR